MRSTIFQLRFVFILLVTLQCTLSHIHGQSVGIGTDDPDSSAALDISSTDTGILIPRMLTSQRTTISNAAAGLLVYDLDTESFWWNDGIAWVELAASSIGLRDTDADTKVTVEETPDADEIALSVAGVPRLRLFDDQAYLNAKLSVGTTAERALFTLRGPNDDTFGPTMFMYGNSSDQSESGRIRMVEGTAVNNWRGAYIHYNGGSNKLHIGTHNTSDADPAADFDAMTIKRINGFVGIHNDNPQQQLAVNGNMKADNGNQVIIETSQNEITLTAGSAAITISSNGDIAITSPTGTLSLQAEDITISAAENLSISTGLDINTTVGRDLNTTAAGELALTCGDDLLLTTAENFDVQANGNVNVDAAANSTYTATNTSIISASIGSVQASTILLNANSSSKGAARIQDSVVNDKIANGSTSVRIGN